MFSTERAAINRIFAIISRLMDNAGCVTTTRQFEIFASQAPIRQNRQKTQSTVTVVDPMLKISGAESDIISVCTVTMETVPSRANWLIGPASPTR